MIQTTAKLIERHTVGPAQELRLAAPILARMTAPGQAMLIRCGWGLEPYLRRTFYPIAVDDESWTLRVPPGDDWGHAWLRAAPIDTELDCLGPIGAGYNLPEKARNLLFVGEGEMAWALLPALVQADVQGLAVTLAIEAFTGRDLIPAQRLPATVEYHTAVSQRWSAQRLGGADIPAGVAQFLPELLPWADAVLAAGSLEFYARLATATRAARYGITRGFAQVLYPATFLCGVGACQACAADVTGGRRRICQHGPVLDLAEVVG